MGRVVAFADDQPDMFRRLAGGCGGCRPEWLQVHDETRIVRDRAGTSSGMRRVALSLACGALRCVVEHQRRRSGSGYQLLDLIDDLAQNRVVVLGQSGERTVQRIDDQQSGPIQCAQLPFEELAMLRRTETPLFPGRQFESRSMTRPDPKPVLSLADRAWSRCFERTDTFPENDLRIFQREEDYRALGRIGARQSPSVPACRNRRRKFEGQDGLSCSTGAEKDADGFGQQAGKYEVQFLFRCTQDSVKIDIILLKTRSAL